MLAILKKEFTNFFTTAIGYLIVGLFLLFNGLLLWYLKGDWNIFESGFADMQAFFDSTPWLFILLISAITMPSFSNEYTTGTIELLKTKPISSWEIVLGKYLSVVLLIIFILIPTLLYSFSVNKLASPETIDWATITGSYLGLLALGMSFSAIGLFASILSTNQIISFIIGSLISFLFYYGIEQWAIWSPNLPELIQNNSLFAHYKSIAKGVLDSRDIIFFMSFSFVFLYFTKLKLDQ